MKKHVPTFENQQYILNNAYCTSMTQMSAYLGLDRLTIKKYYSEQIDKSNARILEKATQALEHLIEAGHWGAIDKVLSKVGTLAEDNQSDININIAGYVDKPKDLPLEEWLKVYGKKQETLPEPEEIEDAEVVEVNE